MKEYLITQEQVDQLGTFLINQQMIHVEGFVNMLRTLPEIEGKNDDNPTK